MGSRIDRVWTGTENPLTVTRATAAAIGLTREDWVAPTETVCSRIALALETAFPADAWTCTRDGSTGKITLTCDTNCDWALAPGFADWAGFTSLSYLHTTSITSEEVPPHFHGDQRLGYSLPLRFYHRTIHAHRAPVLWSSFWAWDLAWHADEAEAVALLREPFVIDNGSSNQWSPTNRDGWIALRPLWDQTQRATVGNVNTFGRFDFRALWLNPTL